MQPPGRPCWYTQVRLNFISTIILQITPTLFKGMFYYVLGNLRPELRSTQRAIQLIACVECPVLEKYGFEKVLAPFIKDVNTLSNVRVVECIYRPSKVLFWLL